MQTMSQGAFDKMAQQENCQTPCAPHQPQPKPVNRYLRTLLPHLR
jgi:hypothetical protein